MASYSQATKQRVVKALQEFQVAHPNQPISLTKAAQALNLSVTCIRQVYRELATAYKLPPILRYQPKYSSIRMPLLKLLQQFQASHPNQPVSLSELAQTFHVSRERIRQLYRQLSAKHDLPPVRERKKLRRETHRRPPSPKTLSFEAEVRMYLAYGMNSTEIARMTGRGKNTVLATLHRLGVPLNKRSRR
jgi:AraC-like DNA-binding protein